MSDEAANLHLLDRLFKEAVRLHGDDLKKVVDHVKKRIDASSLEDRCAIDAALERMLAFQAPDCRPDPLN